MTPETANPASAGGATGSRDTVCFELPDSQAFPKNQAKKRGGRAARQKGDRFERAIVRMLQDAGFGAERIPLSGSAGGSFADDVTTPLLGRDITIECKSRACGFLKIYAWLEGPADLLVIRADRRPPLVVLPLPLALEIALAAERRKP